MMGETCSGHCGPMPLKSIFGCVLHGHFSGGPSSTSHLCSHMLLLSNDDQVECIDYDKESAS